MAKHGSGVQQHGTARDLAEHDAGYSANGESQHSRQVARTNIRLGEGKRTDGRLIREQRAALSKLRFKLSIEMDPERYAKFKKDIAIKAAFVAKLEKQYVDQHATAPATGPTWRRPDTSPVSKDQDRDGIETLPGADEYDPW